MLTKKLKNLGFVKSLWIKKAKYANKEIETLNNHLFVNSSWIEN